MFILEYILIIIIFIILQHLHIANVKMLILKGCLLYLGFTDVYSKYFIKVWS